MRSPVQRAARHPLLRRAKASVKSREGPPREKRFIGRDLTRRLMLLAKEEGDESDNRIEGKDAPIITGFSSDERRLSLFLILALVLWSTDKIHGIAPAWVSLGVGIVCLVPLLGVISPEIFKEKVSISPLLYVAGIIGVGAVVADTGLGAFISERIVNASNLSPDDPLRGFFVLSGIAMFLGFFSTMPGVPAILVPIASDLSVASGLELKTVLMTQVVGFSTVWLPYQVPPIIVGILLKDNLTFSI